jgi:hypothetical protein
MNPSEKLQNLLIDSVFYAEHESDVELWFRAQNKTQKDQIYSQHFLTIPSEFVSFLVLTHF